MKKFLIALVSAILILICIVAPIFFGATPAGRELWNNWFHTVQKADDKTNYETLKKVEDTCRAMISSYTSDKLMYEQYKDKDNSQKQSWAEEAKLRANKTAATYNEYILKNSYVWEGAVPNDISQKLEYLN